MAENQEDKSGEDLSEEASPHRLEEYRGKGMVAQSRELTGLFVLFSAAIVIYFCAQQFALQITEFMKEVFRTDLSSRVDLGSQSGAKAYFFKGLSIMISIGLPVGGTAFVLGALGSFIQVGAIASLDPLMPDFGKLSPLQGLKRLVSFKQMVEGFRIFLKLALILYIAYLLMKTEVFSAPLQILQTPSYLLQSYAQTAKSIFSSMGGVLLLFALVDFGMQKFDYGKSLRMTKQEAKQEHREREGDPQIRARIRAVQREMARKRMMQAVKKATVVVTNPTHLAIALVYDGTSMGAPKVVAKGADFIAQRIKEIAKEAGVPTVENVPLARTLYKTVKVGQFVPRALYQAIAEVLAYVYRLKRGNY